MDSPVVVAPATAGEAVLESGDGAMKAFAGDERPHEPGHKKQGRGRVG